MLIDCSNTTLSSTTRKFVYDFSSSHRRSKFLNGDHVGGFSQPGVARTLIEQPGSIETGLTQRFLWSFPKPSYTRFGTLEAVDEDFTELLGKSVKEVVHTQ